MIFLGLHLLDWLVVLAYFVVLVWIGKATSSTVHGQKDFFLAGRGLGRIYQFFLNFGNMTDASGAAKTSSIVYSQGVGGVWITFQTLFMTPYYWFMNAWFRRARLTTVADLFTDRFGGRSLAALYAVCAILVGTVNLGGGYLVAYKMLDVFLVKPQAALTAAEAQSVASYQEFRKLDAAYRQGALDEGARERYLALDGQRQRGEIKSYYSYISRLPFYIGFALVVGIYITLGGMTAAAITDAFQGVLIIVFSLILIPFGIFKLGGLAEFQAKLPDRMMQLFGSGAASEFAWYSVIAILVLSIIQIHAVSANMAVAGSARDETAASLGAVMGGFTKRLMIIAWCFCGLIAFALFGSGISDPDAVWGVLASSLLSPGFLGLMLVGILAAEMSTLSSQCLSLSALFVRNIYMVMLPGRTEREGLAVGRMLIGLSLLGGIGVACVVDDLLAFTKLYLTLNVAFGAAILLIFKWRRVTKTAVTVSVLVSMVVIVLVPLLVPAIPALARHPAFQLMSREQTIIQTGPANATDVEAGRAAQVGEIVVRPRVIPPKLVFFERQVALSSADPAGPKQGRSRFHFELYLLWLAGVDVAGMKPAELLSICYLFDSALPFLLLFGVSLFTRERDPGRAARFYAKMRTRVVADPESDAAALAAAQADCAASERLKILPGSSWEFLRWRRADALAFLACCGVTVGILGFFAVVLNIGRA
jgi:Na+/proline symporter